MNPEQREARREKRKAELHGTRYCYVEYKCRCEACTKANTEDCHRRLKMRAAEQIPGTVMHGIASTYSNWSCRCEPCRAAWRVACVGMHQRRKERKKKAGG